MALVFPSKEQISALESKELLSDALSSYARILIQYGDRKRAALWCREYLNHDTPKSVRAHSDLRKSIYYLIFIERLVVDSPVETFWDVANCFGPTNEAVTVKYFESAPRSIPLKFGRLLLFIAEFGKPSTISNENFEKSLIIIFSAANIADAVITPEWKSKLTSFRTYESRTLQQLSQDFASDGPVRALTSMFPQLTPARASALLHKSKKSLDELIQSILDDPEYIDSTLKSSPKQPKGKKKPTKYVILDEKEKEAREEAIRQHNRLNFVYEYVSLEDEDPDMDTGEPTHIELSEADKKLLDLEELLWKQWQNNREVFDRKSRKSEARKQLCAKLKWSDEQIEGWGRVVGEKGRAGEDVKLSHTGRKVEAYAPSAKPSSAPPPAREGPNSNAHGNNAARRPRRNNTPEAGKDHQHHQRSTPAVSAGGADQKKKSDAKPKGVYIDGQKVRPKKSGKNQPRRE